MTVLTGEEMLRIRLASQLITSPVHGGPADVVGHFVAMQSQEYAMAKWAVGLRTHTLKENDVETAFNKGEILRTHLLRPTWHFILPKDIRWVLELTAPHVRKQTDYYLRARGIDKDELSGSSRVIEDVLSTGVPMTRAEIIAELEAAGVDTSNHRITHILMDAELSGLICSGPRKGKQFTHVLLENAAPSARTMHRDDALAELASRYFASKGPATVNDFAYWSGLSVKDARTGADSLDGTFDRTSFGGLEYIYRHSEGSDHRRSTFLLPDYDELILGYKDRSLLLPAERNGIAVNAETDHGLLLVRGRTEGKWAAPSGKRMKASAEPLRKVSDDERSEIDSAVTHYREFWS